MSLCTHSWLLPHTAPDDAFNKREIYVVHLSEEILELDLSILEQTDCTYPLLNIYFIAIHFIALS